MLVIKHHNHLDKWSGVHSIRISCKDVDIDSCITNVATTCNNELEKLKFARGAYMSGRHPMIKDDVGL
jgi:hypothetical protein